MGLLVGLLAHNLNSPCLNTWLNDNKDNKYLAKNTL